MYKLVFLFSMLFCSTSFAQPIKVGHMGIVGHDIALRKLSQGSSDISVVPVPGGKGVVSYEALERGRIDFLLVSSGAAFANPILHSDVIKFDPLDKFKVVSMVVSNEPAFLLPQKYTSIDDLASKKCVPGQVVFVANIAGTEPILVKEALKSYPCTFEVVWYVNPETPFIDAVAGRVDIHTPALVAAARYQNTATVIPFSTSKNKLLREFTYDTFMITRRDIPEEMINQLMNVFNANATSDEVIAWQKSTRAVLKLKVGTEAVNEAIRQKTVYKNLLQRYSTN